MNKYEFVPAAIDSLPKGAAVGIKYHKREEGQKTNKHSARYTVETLKNAKIVHMHDRSVYFLKSNDSFNDRLTSLDFDVLHDNDYLLNKSLLSELGYNYTMVNTHAVPKKYHHDDYEHDSTLGRQQWPEIIADSGGFQIRTGVLGFLSPEETVKLQNKVCSIGVALDIPFPLTHRDEVPLFKRVANVQRMNNDVYKEHKRKGLKIMNVIHGPNFYLIDKYREVIEDDDIDHLSIGGVVRLGLTPLVLRLLNVLIKGKKYKHYHALGVSGIERWVALSYLAHKNIAKLITSDSTTYLKNGFNAQFFEPARLCYTRDIRSNLPEVEQFRRLSCSCPTCSTVGYTAPMIDRAVPDGCRAVTSHNLYMNRDYLNEIYQVTTMPHKEILSYLKPHVSPQKLLSIQLAMTAIDMALQDGLEKSAARFSPFLLKKDPTTQDEAGLFRGEQKVTDATKAMRARVDDILTKFEQYHRERT